MLFHPIFIERFTEYIPLRQNLCFYISKNNSPHAICILLQFFPDIFSNYCFAGPVSYFYMNLLLNPYGKYLIHNEYSIRYSSNNLHIDFDFDSDSDTDLHYDTKKHKHILQHKYNIIDEFPNHGNWYELSKDPHAIHLLNKYPNRVNKMQLLFNHNAISLIKKLYTLEELFNDEKYIHNLLYNTRRSRNTY